jgi:hypothetical protein
LASMRSHCFSMSAVLVEWVLPNMKGKSVCEKPAGTAGGSRTRS